jgi:hypothetical protein
VSRPIGRALIVANPAGRADLLSAMQRLGYGATELDDPYAAMAELCQRPLAYRAVVLSLAGLYREELNLMPAIKRRFPHIEIWLSHTDGRQGALADAMRLGADGLLAEDGLHRLAISGGSESTALMIVPPSDPADGAATGGATFATTEISASEISASEISAGEADDAPPRGDLIVSGTVSHDESNSGEPVLTADELRALLHEQTPMPPEEG